MVSRNARLSSFVSAMLLIAITSCGTQTKTSNSSINKATATVSAPQTLPPFTDLRVAYIGQDERLHAVTMDGKTDVTGDSINIEGNNGLAINSAGASPDGHYIAYATDQLFVCDVRSQTPSEQRVHTGNGFYSSIFWASDSQHLIFGDRGNGIHLVYTVPQTIQDAPSIPTTQPGSPDAVDPLGWIDQQHLAVSETLQDATIQLESMDITSGNRRILATFSPENSGIADFSVSSDGHEILYYNRPYQLNPFTPAISIIDTATGALHPLPHITASLMKSYYDWISTVAWKPGTDTLAVSTGYLENKNLENWLLDPGQDLATQISDDQSYVQEWSPDGSTLITSTGWESGIGDGPFTLSALRISSNQIIGNTTLTNNAMSFNFIGFIRSV